MLAGLAALAWAVWWAVPRAGYLHLVPQQLQRVSFTGHEILSGSELLEISGLNPGTRLTPEALRSARDRLTGEELIAGVETEWSWGDLEVRVSERSPLGYLKAGTAFYLLTAGPGRSPRRFTAEPKDLIDGRHGLERQLKRLPLIVLDDPGMRENGEVLGRAARMVLLTRPDRHPEVNRVRVGEDRSWQLELDGGSVVRLGQWTRQFPERIERGLEVWRVKRSDYPDGPIEVEPAGDGETVYVQQLATAG